MIALRPLSEKEKLMLRIRGVTCGNCVYLKNLRKRNGSMQGTCKAFAIKYFLPANGLPEPLNTDPMKPETNYCGKFKRKA